MKYDFSNVVLPKKNKRMEKDGKKMVSKNIGDSQIKKQKDIIRSSEYEFLNKLLINEKHNVVKGSKKKWLKEN